MSEPARQALSLGAFYTWLGGEERKYELIDGQPVMMAGDNRRHDRIVTNALRLIATQLRGHRCQPFTSDTFVAIPAGNRRLPDLGVDCGTPEDTALEASEPFLVVEILSPTNRMFDRTETVEEYKTVPSLHYILVIDPDAPQLRLHQRQPAGAWTSERIAGLEYSVSIASLNVALSLAELYEGLIFSPRPMLLGAPGEL